MTGLETSLIYCSTSKICMWVGILGNYPLAKAFMRQVLPIPFRPTNPYLRPYANFKLVDSSKVFPAIVRWMLSNTKSLFLPVPSRSLLI
jgi:hypothetical protein